VLKKSVLVSTTIVCCMLGCMQQKSGVRQPIDTPEGMIDYLQSINLPTLKSVKVWENDYGPGLKLTTAHYEIFTTLLEPLMLNQVPGFVESAYQGYQGQLPKPIDSSPVKLTVYLFANRKQWEEFTKEFTGPQADLYLKIKKGAYYLNGACVNYNIGRQATFSVLGHEGWHQFNSRYFKYRLPSWLDEGIAMLFENSRYDKGLFYFEPAYNLQRLGALKATLTKQKMIPLKKLLTLNPGEVVGSDDDVMACYCQSYALVRFLREEGYGKRLPDYHQLLTGGLKGQWQLSQENRKTAIDRRIPLTVNWNRLVGLQLFKQFIGDDFRKLEKEYTVFCRKIVYHVHFK